MWAFQSKCEQNSCPKKGKVFPLSRGVVMLGNVQSNTLGNVATPLAQQDRWEWENFKQQILIKWVVIGNMLKEHHWKPNGVLRTYWNTQIKKFHHQASPPKEKRWALMDLYSVVSWCMHILFLNKVATNVVRFFQDRNLNLGSPPSN
jgi:hypothetical protein